MTARSLFALTFAVLVGWVLAISVLRLNLGSDIRLVNNDNDRFIYYEHGQWFADGKVPYRDVFSEYPQVPTYFFALPSILTSVGAPDGDGGYENYSAAFSLLMLTLLVASVVLLQEMLPAHRTLAYLMLLPAPLYFTFNRFDILPAFLVLVALRLLQNGREVPAAVMLAVGALAKWYPALFLPAFLLHVHRRHGRLSWQMVLAFGVTCVLIVAPTLLAGGLDAFLVPYRFHQARELVTGSLPLLVHDTVVFVAGASPDGSLFRLCFVILQFVGVPLGVLSRLDTFEDVLRACLLAVIPFILFSRVASPQWILWILPLAILTARTRADAAWLVFYGLATYVTYPLVWDGLGEKSGYETAMWVVLFVIMIRIAARSFVDQRGARQSWLAR